jgi:hypothetical protein
VRQARGAQLKRRLIRIFIQEFFQVEVRSDFACQVASPADSVGLVALDTPP